MRISVDELSWAVGEKTIVRNVNLDIGYGETVGLIGPNGSGKSSLLRCIAGVRRPTTGSVNYDSHDIADWSPRQVAQQVAFVEQAAESDSDLHVCDVVALGRFPFRGRWRGLTERDHLIIEAALTRVGLTHLWHRAWHTLSGGERQRVHIARALAQQPWGLLLDEPTNHLDVRHQLELMELLADNDQTVLVALHDLSLAARFCDRLVLLHGGVVVASGVPQDVLTAARLRDVFEIDGEIGYDALGNLSIAYRGVAGQLPEPVGS